MPKGVEYRPSEHPDLPAQPPNIPWTAYPIKADDAKWLLVDILHSCCEGLAPPFGEKCLVLWLCSVNFILSKLPPKRCTRPTSSVLMSGAKRKDNTVQRAHIYPTHLDHNIGVTRVCTEHSNISGLEVSPCQNGNREKASPRVARGCFERPSRLEINTNVRRCPPGYFSSSFLSLWIIHNLRRWIVVFCVRLGNLEQITVPKTLPG